jgi:hypothetical protein
MRAQRQILGLLAAAAILLASGASAMAADPAISSTTVAASSATAAAPAPAAPAPPSSASPLPSLSDRASQALRDLAAAYTGKQRTQFMRHVSDDFTGDLGAFEDALSSDFRSYRTINLSMIPDQVSIKGARAQVTFHFNMTVTNDQGKNTRYNGNAAYTFVDENGKANLLTMDRTPIFGTSLSSVENPIAKSQGTAPTPVGSPPVSPALDSGATAQAPVGSPLAPAWSQPTAQASDPCLPTTLSASVTLPTSGSSFSFDLAAIAGTAAGDIEIDSYPQIYTNGGAAITDLGACSLSALTLDPAVINSLTVTASVGECYAVLTNASKYAAFRIVSYISGKVTLQYKYQKNGQRCF